MLCRSVSTLLFLLLLALNVGCTVGYNYVFRLMSYNIRSGSNINDTYNINATAAAINAQMPDLVGLQEVDNDTARHPGQDQPAILAALTGMQYRYGKMRDFEGGGYGIAILSRFEILETLVFRYNKPNSTWESIAGDGIDPTPVQDCGNPVNGDFCQGALAVLVDISDGSYPAPLWHVNTHLGLTIEYNETLQLMELLTNISHLSVSSYIPDWTAPIPIFVTGDFNSVPTSAAIAEVMTGGDSPFADMWQMCGNGPGYTFNSSMPYERIDYQFLNLRELHRSRAEDGFSYGPLIECMNMWVPSTEASDHRPVVGEYVYSFTMNDRPLAMQGSKIVVTE